MAGDAIASGRPLASFEGLELAVPECARGLGSVILDPQSADLIGGVRAEPFPIYPDDRGYFLEVQRLGGGLTQNFPPESIQVSAAGSYPDTIKAFHFHLRQTDCWVPVSGMFQVALADLRSASRTFGRRNTFYVGRLRPWRILIPPGVAHGYKIIGGQEALLVYLTDRFYDPRDEGRIAYNDASINYDWEMQHK